MLIVFQFRTEYILNPLFIYVYIEFKIVAFYRIKMNHPGLRRLLYSTFFYHIRFCEAEGPWLKCSNSGGEEGRTPNGPIRAKIFFGCLTKLRPGWHQVVFSCTVQLFTKKQSPTVLVLYINLYKYSGMSVCLVFQLRSNSIPTPVCLFVCVCVMSPVLCVPQGCI